MFEAVKYFCFFIYTKYNRFYLSFFPKIEKCT